MANFMALRHKALLEYFIQTRQVPNTLVHSLEVAKFSIRNHPWSSSFFVFACSFATAAHAACPPTPADTRLQTLCLTEQAEGKAVDLRTIQLIDFRIKQEGYARGLGLLGAVKQHQFAPYATPIIDYSNNINGGNPDRTLALGNLDFEGDPKLVRTKGLVAGVGFGANGRNILGAGRYIDYTIGGSWTNSAQHNQTITRAFASACSKNHIENLWYLDGCATTSSTARAIQTDRNSSLSLAVSKLIASGNNYHQASAGVRRYFDKDYEQNQLVASVDTIRVGSVFTSFSLTLGEGVESTLATRQSVSATLGTFVNQRALRATANYSYSDGGKLLGVDRADTAQSLSITFAAHPRFSLSVGYRNTDSSIDYFDDYEPNVGVQLTPFTF